MAKYNLLEKLCTNVEKRFKNRMMKYKLQISY